MILTNICFSSVSVHYDAEIECTVIDMMQLKNLHENVAIERVYDYTWNEPLISLLILSLLELLAIIFC